MRCSNAARSDSGSPAGNFELLRCQRASHSAPSSGRAEGWALALSARLNAAVVVDFGPEPAPSATIQPVLSNVTRTDVAAE